MYEAAGALPIEIVPDAFVVEKFMLKLEFDPEVNPTPAVYPLFECDGFFE